MDADPGTYRFGPFTLDACTLELTKGGESVPLPRQPATLLGLLLENAGRLVTREEIQRLCWPDTRHGADPVINAAVRQVRRALGDSVSAPRFVETLPRRGYRFKAGVTRSRSRRRRSPLLRAKPGAESLAAGLALAVLALLMGHSRPTTGVAEVLPENLRLTYSKAAVLLEARDPGRASRSLPLFEEVLAAEPRFVPAWAGLAEARFLAGDREGSRQAARAALRRSPDLASAHHLLGMVRLVEDWDFAGSEESVRRAVALQPEDHQYRISLAFVLISAGAPEEAGRLLDEVYRADPVRFALKADAGWMEYLLGRYERSLELCAAAADIEPADVWSEDCATADLARLGRYEEAVARTQDALARWGFDAAERPWTRESPARAKLLAYWAWRARRLEERGAPGSHYRLATLYAELARPDDALRALEEAAGERSMAVVAVRAEPSFGALRGHPRFEALLRPGKGRDAAPNRG